MSRDIMPHSESARISLHSTGLVDGWLIVEFSSQRCRLLPPSTGFPSYADIGGTLKKSFSGYGKFTVSTAILILAFAAVIAYAGVYVWSHYSNSDTSPEMCRAKV